MTRLMLFAALLSVPVLAGPPQPISLGIAQPYGKEAAEKVPALVEPYLEKAMKAPVKVVRFDTAEALVDALVDGKVDLAWITPLAYVQATQRNAGITPLVKAMRFGALTYRATFIARKGAPTELSAYQGKKVAWVSKSSTSGYLVAREILRKQGLSPDGFFADEAFAGDHPSVCRAVREGRADLGATFGDEPAEGKDVVPSGCKDVPPVSDYTVVASVGNLPNEVIAMRDLFPPAQVNGLMAAFGRMTDSPAGKKVLEAFRVDGWWAAVEGDFAPVLELMSAKPKAAPEPKPSPEPKKAPPAAVKKAGK